MNALQRISTGIELLGGGYVVEWTPSRETEPGVRTMAYPNYDRRLMEALWGASELVGTDYDYVNRVDEVRDNVFANMARAVQFIPWRNGGRAAAYGWTSNQLTADNLLDLANNYAGPGLVRPEALVNADPAAGTGSAMVRFSGT